MADFDEGTVIMQLQKVLKNQYQQIGDAMIGGGEVRLLNDDEVLATIENPEDIYHQY